MIKLYNLNLGNEDLCSILTQEYGKLQPLLLTKIFMNYCLLHMGFFALRAITCTNPGGGGRLGN
jgi:hypothetical protein